MENNKLGLKIVRINQGYTNLLAINESPVWTRSVWDVRNALESVNGRSSERAVMMLSGVEGGNLITVAAGIPGRGADCISAWIFVPSTVHVSGSKLESVLIAVKREILADSCNEALLRQLFDEAYPPSEAFVKVVQSSGERYAVKYFGPASTSRSSLADLLDAGLNQSVYGSYRCVFLLDASSGQSCPSATDISAVAVQRPFLLPAMQPVDGYVPFVNNTPLDKARYVLGGTQVTVIWKKDGYKSIEKTFTAVEGCMVPGIDPADYKRVITPAYVAVMNKESHQRILDCCIKIEDKELRQTGLAVSESRLASLRISVTASGYSSYSGTVDLTRPVTIYLEEQAFKYRFAFPLKNGSEHIFEYVSRGPLSEVPFAGFCNEDGSVPRIGGTNYLMRVNNTKSSLRTLIFCVVILLIGIGGGIGLGYVFFDGSTAKSEEKQEERIETRHNGGGTGNVAGRNDRAEQHLDRENNVQTPSVVKYLDENLAWEKQKLEQYHQSKGLFEALNTYDYDEILKYEKDLKGSVKFKKLLACVKVHRENLRKLKLKDDNAHYLGADDTTITVDKYMERISKTVEPDESGSESRGLNSQSPGPSGNHGNTGNQHVDKPTPGSVGGSPSAGGNGGNGGGNGGGKGGMSDGLE